MLATNSAGSVAPQRHEKLQIVIVGTSGSGKSATGNTIIGERKFKSMVSDQSVTVECQREKTKIDDIEVTVIDTPGCHCTSLPHEQVIAKLKELTDTLELPYAFLLVIPAGYFTPKENQTVSMLQEALGELYLSHTVIIFSQSDNLELKNISNSDFIQGGNKEFKSLIQKYNVSCHFVNNRKRMAKDAMRNLMGDLMKVAKKKDMPHILMTPQKGNKSSTGRSEYSFQGSQKQPISGGQKPNPTLQGGGQGRGSVNEGPQLNPFSSGLGEGGKEERLVAPGKSRTKPSNICEGVNQMTPKSKAVSTHLLANTCFLVLGMKGVGKSTSIRSILPGAEHTVVEECSVYSDGQMKMVECPGFDEDPGEIRQAIQRGLRVCAPGPHVILIVMKVERFSPAVKKTMQHVQEILGEVAQKNVIVIFTRKADLEDASIEEFISDSKDLADYVKMFGSKYFALENRHADIQSQVTELKSMIAKLLNTKSNSEYTVPGIPNQPISGGQKPNPTLQGGGQGRGSVNEGPQLNPFSSGLGEGGKEERLVAQGKSRTKPSNICGGVNQISKSKAVSTHLLANTCFLVLGMKGVGKSTSIRSILPGAEHTVVEECSVYSDGQMKMVECPGFDEDPAEIREAIQRGLRVCAPGPHVILIIRKVRPFSPAVKKTMQHVQEIFREVAQKNVIVIFTRKADLEDGSIEEFISDSKDLANFVTMFGSRYFALENRHADIQSQVTELKSMIAELLNTKSNSEYTVPGSQKQPISGGQRPTLQGGGQGRGS